MFWPICALCRASMLCRQARRMPGGYCRAWLLRYTRSVDLEAGLFDHVGPAFLFRDQQFAQVFPRRSDNNEAIAFQQLAHAVRFKCSYRLLIQDVQGFAGRSLGRSEEHTSELQSLMRISYAVFCFKK